MNTLRDDTMFGNACYDNDTYRMQGMVDNGFNVSILDNDVYCDHYKRAKRRNGWHPVANALSGGSVGALMFIIDNGYDMSKCRGDISKYINSVPNSHCYQILIDHGFDITKNDNACIKSINYKFSPTDLVNLMVANGADPSLKFVGAFRTVKFTKVRVTPVQNTQELLDLGVDVSYDNFSAIRGFIYNCHTDIIKVLIDNKIDFSPVVANALYYIQHRLARSRFMPRNNTGFDNRKSVMVDLLRGIDTSRCQTFITMGGETYNRSEYMNMYK